MTPDEERRAKAAENKRAYRLRKKQENLARQASPEQLTTMFKEQARNIAPELEEQFRKEQGNSETRPFPPGVLYQDRREQAQAVIADAEERNRRVELIMSKYQKDACNTNALLKHILAHLIRVEITLQDRLK